MKKTENQKVGIHTLLFKYDDDFAETKTMAEKIAKQDPAILSTIPNNQINIIKKNGIYCHLMRTLVEMYVKNKKDKFLSKIKSKKNNDEVDVEEIKIEKDVEITDDS